MATLETIEPFSPTIINWNAHSDRFEQYVIANEIEDKKKVMATFLTTNGSKTYNILRDLLAPAKPSELKFEELAETLRNQYEPKQIVIAEPLHFHKREQHEREGVAAYNDALKNCSDQTLCFWNIEEAFRDRFVCGLRNKSNQKKTSSI